MKYKSIKIKDIKPSSYNPRYISNEDLIKLKNSIDEFGLTDPIVINLKNNVIIGGHQRFTAIKELYPNLKELPLIEMGNVGWIFLNEDLDIKDENHEKALNLALNKISGEWDFDKLNVILEDLKLNDFDITLSGFEIEEIEEFSSDVIYENEENEEIYEIEDDIEVNVKLGDMFRLGNHILMCGDSTNKNNINNLISNNNINMIFTDPPYGMGLNTDYSVMESNLKFIGDKSAFGGTKYKQGMVDEFDGIFIENILDLNVDETFLWGADYYTEYLPNIKNGSWFVWDKRSNENTTIDEAYSSDKMFGSTFELCWSKTKHKREIARIKWAGLFGTEQEFDKKRHHPTQKPIKLCKWFIEKFSNENDNILDLFGGSGATLLACEESNRKAFLMELDPYYCQVIINRWEDYTKEKAKKIND